MIFFCLHRTDDGDTGCQRFWTMFPTNRKVTKAPRRLCPDCIRKP